MTNTETLHFKTNVQLKSIIGKDLINDDNIAILELVKNSFDANAKKVIVKYLNLKNNDDKSIDSYSDITSRLIIADNGLGMDLDDIQDKWLNIAYSEKKENKTQNKRRMAGAKGVGRFSCDRLGEYLNLYAKKKGDDKYVKLSIDWKQFEIEDDKIEIQFIPLQYNYLTSKELISLGIDAFEQGVLLEIIKLRSSWAYQIKDEWSTKKFVELKKYLEKLINPNQAFVDDDFGIYLSAPEFKEENRVLDEHDKFIGKVQNRIFDKLDFKSTSIETRSGDNGETIFTELKDKGETIFWIKEINPFYPYLKNVKISLYYLNPYAKAFFTKQTGIQSVNYGSVFMFVNGFRIPPYGEVGNDWLGLDQRHAQGTKRYLGQRNIIGQIEILDEENDFQIISSREGIVNNDNFKKLTSSTRNDSLFFKTLRRLERFVVDGLDWDSSIYDPQDGKFKEIERKIIAGKTKEDELEYRESDKTKKSRVYSAIHSIIAAKADNVIELYINEKLITDKIEEERKNSEIEFEQLIVDFEDKKIDSDTLSRILAKKAEQNEELEKQIKDFSKYTTSEATTKAILELQNYKKRIEEQAKLIEQLQNQLTVLMTEKEKAEETVKTYKEKVENVETDLNIEKQKNLYLLATRRSLSEGTLSKDADGLIHTIKIDSINIRNGIDNTLEALAYDGFKIDDIVKRLGNIRLNAERSIKLTEIATRSDFNENIEERSLDIVTYVTEYIGIYGHTFSEDIDYEIIVNNSSLIASVSILNLSIVLDNIISNAIKWDAKKIQLLFNNLSETELSLIISDDGKGLIDKFFNNPERIFELSVRESSPNGFGGSGIGLYFTKELLKEMDSSIEFIGNNKYLNGASFEIKFRTI
jgi:signal transduction histidine kinase